MRVPRFQAFTTSTRRFPLNCLTRARAQSSMLPSPMICLRAVRSGSHRRHPGVSYFGPSLWALWLWFMPFGFAATAARVVDTSILTHDAKVVWDLALAEREQTATREGVAGSGRLRQRRVGASQIVARGVLPDRALAAWRRRPGQPQTDSAKFGAAAGQAGGQPGRARPHSSPGTLFATAEEQPGEAVARWPLSRHARRVG